MKIVFINGAPASGKSTLIDAIKDDLIPIVIRKDVIKEHLYDTLGTYGEAWSQMLGVNISKFVIVLADDILRSGKSVVIEGAFHRELAREDIERLQNNHPDLEVVEIYCETTPEVLRRRFEDRTRHNGYHSLPMHQIETLEKYTPINMGKLIRVDTTYPETVDSKAIIAAINS